MNGNARKHRDTQSETQPSQQPLCCLASGPLMERVPTSGRLCSGVQTPSDPVSLFCVPGELAAAGWVLPAPAAGGPSVSPAADNGRRCGETARRVGMLGGGLQGQDVRACARPASVSAASLTALVSPLMALIPSSAWKPGLLGSGAFDLVASCCA